VLGNLFGTNKTPDPALGKSGPGGIRTHDLLLRRQSRYPYCTERYHVGSIVLCATGP
jgi:hypothetical protein